MPDHGRGIKERRPCRYHNQGYLMVRLTLLALTLLSSGAQAGSESNVRPTIIRCDYETPNRDPRCVGVGPADGSSTTERPHRKSLR
jgi:hypothetical protein